LLVFLTVAGVATLIVTRQPGNLIGWLFLMGLGSCKAGARFPAYPRWCIQASRTGASS
jgi:hypothetical protein